MLNEGLRPYINICIYDVWHHNNSKYFLDSRILPLWYILVAKAGLQATSVLQLVLYWEVLFPHLHFHWEGNVTHICIPAHLCTGVYHCTLGQTDLNQVDYQCCRVKAQTILGSKKFSLLWSLLKHLVGCFLYVCL